MNRIGTQKKMVALSLLPALFLFLISFSNAQNQVNIPAIINVNPSATIVCEPHVLSIGSGVQWINCFIELDGADVNNIDISTVRLGVVGLSGKIPADTSFGKVIGDFDHDGKPDLQVRFSRATADSLWFSKSLPPKDFTLALGGNVGVFSFGGNDIIQIVQRCSTGKVKYTQIGLLKADKPTKGNLNVIDDVDLSIYSQEFSHFSGFFLCRDRLIGNAAFYTTGYLNVPKTANFFRIPIKYIDKQPVRISVLFDKFDDCVGNSNKVHCSGSGKLIIWNEGTREWDGFDLKTLRFDIVNGKAKIEGGNFWNDILSVENIQMGRITIK